MKNASTEKDSTERNIPSSFEQYIKRGYLIQKYNYFFLFVSALLSNICLNVIILERIYFSNLNQILLAPKMEIKYVGVYCP